MDADVLGLINSGIAAVSGLVGASIGALVTVSVARSSSVRDWNREIFSHSMDFYLSMIEAINDQNLALNAAAAELEAAVSAAREKLEDLPSDQMPRKGIPFQRSPEIVERVKVATAAFRSVLARSVIYGDVDMVGKLNALDKSRHAVTVALNENNLPAVQSGLRLMSTQLRPLYRSAQREVTRHNLIALNSMHPFRGRRKARNELLGNIRLLDERDTKEDSTSEQPEPS